MLKRRLMAGLCATGLGFATLGSVASADHGLPVGGCPKGNGGFLIGVEFIIPGVDNGNYKDNNGDGFICVKFNKGQTKKSPEGGAFTAKDNTNPLNGYVLF